MLGQLVGLCRFTAQAHDDCAVDIRVLGDIRKAATHDIDALANLPATLNVGKSNRPLDLCGNPLDSVVCAANS